MLNITSSIDLVNFFSKYQAATRAVVVTRTPVKMNKKDVATKEIPNPFTEVFKVQTIEVELNADYEQKVNDQRLLEGIAQDFVAGSRNWGKRVNGSIVEKQGQLYLHCIVGKKVGKAKYETKSGRAVDYSEFAAFVPKYNGTPSQELENEVQVRDFKLQNVIGLNIDDKVRFINV